MGKRAIQNMYVGGSLLNKIPLPSQVRARKRARKYTRFKTKVIVIARTPWLASLELHKVSKAHTNIFWVTPEVEGKPLQMELDTGSAVSVLPLSKYNTTFKSSKLHPTTTVLNTYTRERIQPVGVFNVQVKYKEEMQKLNLYVVETKGPALFGRDWLGEITLDWKAINTLATTPPGNPSTRLQEILDKYSDVFEEDIGLLKTTKAKLNLKENSQPKFCKARQVPYALRPKVEVELTKLQNDGILTKVDWSEWATPIVPVIKKNGNVRLCGDFKKTSIQSCTFNNTLSQGLMIFSPPSAVGKSSARLICDKAYLQMEMEEQLIPIKDYSNTIGLYLV